MSFTTRSKRPLRLAVIGIGKIAQDQHLPAIAAAPRFTLVAAVSRNATVDGVPNYRDIADLLAADHTLDAVSICTPPVGGASIAMAAIDAGLHVMLKIPRHDVVGDRSDQGPCRDCGRGFVHDLAFAEAAGVAAARAWLADRKVLRMIIDQREDIRRWHPGQDWILDAGGFGVQDPGINALSIATKILPGAWTVRCS